jgi:Gpi18-like mannosyltransferase
MKSIRKSFHENRQGLRLSFLFFLCWRLFLFVPISLSQFIFPLQNNFLGGGLNWYSKNPFLWGLANFDGEHYLSIAQNGYTSYQHFFFPLYPTIIRLLGKALDTDLISYLISGLFVSHLSFFLALFGLWKLLNLDYSRKISKLTILIILAFPTSFYFAGVYTESLFLCLATWTFYFARKKKWLLAACLGGLASGTRVVGIILFPSLLIDLLVIQKDTKYWHVRKSKILNAMYLLLIPLGTIAYMFYLKMKVGDPLIFIHSVNIFGPQRSSQLVILPQVFYRYIFKILPVLNYLYFQLSFTTILEFGTAVLFLTLSMLSLIKLRLSYSIYLISGYLIPTLSGSFSSLPRYVLVLFPGFIILAMWLEKQNKIVKDITYAVLVYFLFISEAMFIRGYWVS